MFTVFKLLWLKQQRPDVFANARQFLCFEDLFQQRLGLEPAISWPLAGRTMLFNVRTHEWDDENSASDRTGPAAAGPAHSVGQRGWERFPARWLANWACPRR